MFKQALATFAVVCATTFCLSTSARADWKTEWDASVAAFKADALEMEKLVADPKTDLLARIKHGDGQTILREALMLADHNSYHLGQLVQLKKLLGAWKG